MDDPAQRRTLDEIEHQVIHARPDTLTEIDARIALEHQREEDAYSQGQDGVAEWYALDIERLRNLRRIVAGGTPIADELRRAKRRHLSQRYAHATWRGDTESAALLQRAIDRIERGAS